MATWVNLLDVIYPTGSVYLSRKNTSPASIIGGTWTQIKGAVLAACGANSFVAANYGGSLKISTNQMPSHTHTLSSTGTYSENSPLALYFTNAQGGGSWRLWSTNTGGSEGVVYNKNTGGGKIICLTTTEYISGTELHKAGDLVWQLL